MDLRKGTAMIAKRALREIIAARTWREVLYALLGWPLGMLGFAAVAATLLLTVASIGTVVVLVPILPLFLALDRVVAGLCRRTANRLLGLDVPSPTRSPGARSRISHCGCRSGWCSSGSASCLGSMR